MGLFVAALRLPRPLNFRGFSADLRSVTAAPKSEQINHFTCLRLILASLVIVGHAAELTDGNPSRELFHRLGARLTAGDFAVDAFFVISGYLILQSLNQQPSVRAFLVKRVL